MTYSETVIKIKALKAQAEILEATLFRYLKVNDEIILENGDKFTLREKHYGDFKIDTVYNCKGNKVNKRKFLRIEDASKVVSINGELV